jgi:hypothetical protein
MHQCTSGSYKSKAFAVIYSSPLASLSVSHY